MWLFAVLSWYWAVVGLGGALNILGANSHNSRFGGFNSRLGQRKFPVRAATGIGLQDLDLARRFYGRTALRWANRRNFPLEREKPGVCERALIPRHHIEADDEAFQLRLWRRVAAHD